MKILIVLGTAVLFGVSGLAYAGSVKKAEQSVLSSAKINLQDKVDLLKKLHEQGVGIGAPCCDPATHYKGHVMGVHGHDFCVADSDEHC